MHTAINALLSQGCSGQRQDQKVCRSRGGESCAFDGAMIVLQPIADAAHIVHGPIACLGNSWEGRGSRSRQGTLDRIGLTTDMSELDIVFGGEEKLTAAVKEAVRRFNPSAVFLYATCISGLTGEGMEAVAAQCTKDLSLPVIAVNAPGFVGPKNLGNRIAGEVLLEHVIGTGTPQDLAGNEINLIGEYNIAGDLWLLEPLFEAAGIRILSRITGDATYREITCAHGARLNVMVCSRALINVAQQMRQRWGIPFIEASVFGPRGVSATLRAIAQALDIEKVKQRVERVIEQQEHAVAQALRKYAHFQGMRVIVYSGGVKSWAMVSALQDLGFEVVAVGTKKSTLEDERKIRALLGPDAPMEEHVTPKKLSLMMKERNAQLMVAGGRNLYLGAKEGFPFIDVNQERVSAYAGYEGFLNLARDIETALSFYGLGAEAPAAATGTDGFEYIKHALSVNPLKHSPALGAALALQGIHGTLPLLHGAQGCNFLGKVLLTKHFREPIALMSTKLFTEDVVMGSEERLEAVLRDAQRDLSPALSVVINTALPEVKGEDTAQVLQRIRAATDTPVALVHAPDYEGGFEDGYVRAVTEVINTLVPARDALPDVLRDPHRITILGGPFLSPEDFHELRDAAALFGLEATLLPDLSALDGSRTGLSSIAHGGVSIQDIRAVGGAALTIAIGACMEAPARRIEELTGVAVRVLPSAGGLGGSDALIEILSDVSGTAVPQSLSRRRRILVDAMRDAYLLFGGRRVCLALEPSHAAGMSRMLHEMGARVSLAVLPQEPKYDCPVMAERVVIGDLSCLQSGAYDLMISNSHAARIAAQRGIPLYHAGFPAHKVMGMTGRATLLYRGSRALLDELSNLLMEAH